MGSIITLGINKLEIDWGKNQYYNNHSKLFNITDLKDENYYYADNCVEVKKAYSAPLSKIKDRLELLGYTLLNVEKIYNFNLKFHQENYGTEPSLSFNQFFKALQSISFSSIQFGEDDEYSRDHDFGRYFLYCIKDKLNIKSPKYFDRYQGQFFENLDPYIILRLILERDDVLEEKLIWRFLDVIEDGFVKEEEIYEPLSEHYKYLLITEGTTDLLIIKKSIDLLYPELADFFSFIDMEKNYPFTGVGNLFNFVKGLAKIKPLNKIVVIFDNDTAGIEKYDNCKNINIPPSIRIIKLPKLKEFNKFLTIGPTGSKIMNINDSAVSIECFLDLNYNNDEEPAIRWGGFNTNLSKYQGALENKEKYSKSFEKLDKGNCTYNYSKLKKLLKCIINECINMNNDTFNYPPKFF